MNDPTSLVMLAVNRKMSRLSVKKRSYLQRKYSDAATAEAQDNYIKSYIELEAKLNRETLKTSNIITYNVHVFTLFELLAQVIKTVTFIDEALNSGEPIYSFLQQAAEVLFQCFSETHQ